MTVIDAGKPDEAREENQADPSGANAAAAANCPSWCQTHVDHSAEGVSHCRLIEEIAVREAECWTLEVSVIQERVGGVSSDPAVYIGNRAIREHEVIRHTPESAHVLAGLVDAAVRNRACAGLLGELGGDVLPHLPLKGNNGEIEWLERLPIALRLAAHAITDLKRSLCPSWCVEEHTLSFDTLHMAAGIAIPLSRYPYWVKGECFFAPALVGLRQDWDDRAPAVALASHDDAAEELLTLDEAEDLGSSLLQMVAIARGQESPSNL